MPAPGVPESSAGQAIHQVNASVSAGTEPPREEAEAAGLPRPDATPALPTDRRLPILALHRGWQPHHLPDVHSAVSWAIIEAIIDIVAGEGPVITDRVYELYVRASGGHRVTKPVRDALDQAVTGALRRGLLQKTQDRVTGRSIRTLYLPGTPPVVPRRRGDRELEHVPPAEVAAVARHILDCDTGISDTELKRLLLIAFDRVRMTEAASDFLDAGIALARR
jgi:hypothetical protein